MGQASQEGNRQGIREDRSDGRAGGRSTCHIPFIRQLRCAIEILTAELVAVAFVELANHKPVPCTTKHLLTYRMIKEQQCVNTLLLAN